jgi:hypothetical protein
MAKPIPGHKFQGAQCGFTPRCECGWTGATHFGKGARTQATYEWHSHIERHYREKLLASDPADRQHSVVRA